MSQLGNGYKTPRNHEQWKRKMDGDQQDEIAYANL